MIKVIFFDLGEVVLTNDWHYDCPEKFAAFSKYYGISNDQMEEGWTVAWPRYEIGNISENNFWKIFLKNAGATNVGTTQAKIYWRKYIGSKQGMFGILKQLKKRYTLAVLSSTGKEWLKYKINKYKLNSYFSCYITTSNTKFIKTDKKIYQFALSKLKIMPEDALFIDDSEKVLLVAKKLGIKTLLFKNPKQLIRNLHSFKMFP